MDDEIVTIRNLRCIKGILNYSTDAVRTKKSHKIRRHGGSSPDFLLIIRQIIKPMIGNKLYVNRATEM